ncbi:chorismate mutase [Parasphingorhabdus halotolerans]|nr:chorismate mutase [Parasphingorhabdus halotolerans]
MTKSSDLPLMENMSDVRIQVDRIDSEIVQLLSQRFACMTAAARIKGDRDTVRDEDRKSQVIQNVKDMAAQHGVPVPMVAAIWEMLVETSISYEFQKWDSIRDD